MTEFHIAWLVLAAFAGLVAWAVLNDVLSYRIPNSVCAALVLLYPAWLVAAWPAADPWLHVAMHVGVALAALAVGFVLFLLRAFGAGDAKLLAAVALWAGPALIFELVIVTAIAGGVLSLAVIVLRALAHRFSFYILTLQVVAGRVAARMAPGASDPAGRSTGKAPRGPSGTAFARPVPYGVAIGAGAAIVAYGLLTTSGAA